MGNPLPPLTAEEYGALRADIARRGVMVAVEIDADTGEIVDGEHRCRIAGELGIDYPRVERHFASDDERTEHALVLNLLRRRIDDETWADAFEELARLRGIRLGSGGDQKSERSKRKNGASVADLAAQLGTTTRTAQNRRQNAKRIKTLRERRPDLADQVKGGQLRIERAERMAREDAAKAHRAAATPRTSSPDLVHGDFREVLAGRDLAGAVVITDPPYPREYLPEWGAMAAVTFDAGADSLIAMCGQSILPDALNAILQAGWRYRWCGSYLTPGATLRVWEPRIGTRWKPILIFDRGHDRDFLLGDVWESGDRDKRHHEWGQSETGTAHLVEAFSEPGQLVVDPFLGGGTTAVVCKALGRRFLGCDIDADAVGVTLERLEGVLAA